MIIKMKPYHLYEFPLLCICVAFVQLELILMKTLSAIDISDR